MRILFFALAALCIQSCKTKFENPDFLTTPSVRLDSLSTPILNSGGNGVNCRAHGLVLASGGLEVERGFIWDDTLENPTWEYNDAVFRAPAKGVGAYNILMTNVGPNRTIYVRSYARNAQGVALSATQSISTPKSRPRLVINPVSSFTNISATLSGTLVFTGGEAVTEQGFVIGTVNNPTIANSTRIDVPITQEGAFYSADASGLAPNTRYNVRCFAVNSLGISYSTQVNFTTLP
jgi:hypothetical protein